jgi:hypothetical protein
VVGISGKDTSTHRLTHILRPNATRPDQATRMAFATPPTTDADFSSHSLYDSDVPSSLSDVQSTDGGSDVLSESDFASDDLARGQHMIMARPLSDIASDVDADVETGSLLGGGDSDLEQATEALSLSNDNETPRPRLRARATVWDHHYHARSGSSPSRSPARRKPCCPSGRAMTTAKKKLANRGNGRKDSFYDYLFK